MPRPIQTCKARNCYVVFVPRFVTQLYCSAQCRAREAQARLRDHAKDWRSSDYLVEPRSKAAFKKFSISEDATKRMVSEAQKLFSCDAVRIVNPLGVQAFLIVGYYRTSKNEWYKNGKPISFRYLQETCVASGYSATSLLAEMRKAAKISKFGCGHDTHSK